MSDFEFKQVQTLNKYLTHNTRAERDTNNYIYIHIVGR